MANKTKKKIQRLKRGLREASFRVIEEMVVQLSIPFPLYAPEVIYNLGGQRHLWDFLTTKFLNCLTQNIFFL